MKLRPRLDFAVMALVALFFAACGLAAPAQAVNLSSVLQVDISAGAAVSMPGQAGDGYWNGTTGCIFQAGYPGYHLTSYDLTVVGSGTYAYSDEFFGGLDIAVAIYPHGGFDPANSTGNCVATADDHGSWPLSATTYTVVVMTLSASGSGTGKFRLTGPGPVTVSGRTTLVGSGGGGTGGSVESPPTPIATLSLSSPDVSCTGGNRSGVQGSWLSLPSAGQCTQSNTSNKAGAILLGWSTSANFPIARAQAQVDRNWGAIDESIDGTRMIFIPAGMATFVTGNNNLFPVWSR